MQKYFFGFCNSGLFIAIILHCKFFPFIWKPPQGAEKDYCMLFLTRGARLITETGCIPFIAASIMVFLSPYMAIAYKELCVKIIKELKVKNICHLIS